MIPPCPVCDSTEAVQKASALYAAGTSESAYLGVTTGVGVLGGGVALGRGYTSGQGVSQTRLSQRLSPPRVPTYRSPFSLALTLLLAIGAVIGVSAGAALLMTLGAALYVATLWVLTLRWRARYTRACAAYTRGMAAWSTLFYCHRCDRIFYPAV